MTKKNKNGRKKLIVLLTSVAILLLVTAAIYLIFFNGRLLGWQPFPPSPSPSPTTQSSNDTNHGTKDDVNPGTDKTTDQIPVSTDLTATIDELSQSNGLVSFKGSANDSKSGGTCSVVFSNPNDRPITRTVKSNVNGSTATCETIQIPETEFSFLGEWEVTFRYYSGDIQAVTEGKIGIR